MNPAIISVVVCVVLCHSAVLQQLASAEGSLENSIDCTDVSIDYTDDPGLTREERLRLMDKAFEESLNKFELCQSADKRAKSAGGVGTVGSGGRGTSGGGGGGAKGDSGNPDEGSGGELAGDTTSSVASSTMSGTEPSPEISPAEGITAREEGAAQDIAETGSKINGGMTRPNGKPPEDIPPANNDDALAAQIRYAAENEPDPVKARQLWNEYRKYQGMAPKN